MEALKAVISKSRKEQGLAPLDEGALPTISDFRRIMVMQENPVANAMAGINARQAQRVADQQNGGLGFIDRNGFTTQNAKDHVVSNVAGRFDVSKNPMGAAMNIMALAQGGMSGAAKAKLERDQQRERREAEMAEKRADDAAKRYEKTAAAVQKNGQLHETITGSNVTMQMAPTTTDTRNRYQKAADAGADVIKSAGQMAANMAVSAVLNKGSELVGYYGAKAKYAMDDIAEARRKKEEAKRRMKALAAAERNLKTQPKPPDNHTL